MVLASKARLSSTASTSAARFTLRTAKRTSSKPKKVRNAKLSLSYARARAAPISLAAKSVTLAEQHSAKGIRIYNLIEQLIQNCL